MSLTLLIVFISVIASGIGFWFYNRKQINSLNETLEDKNVVINTLREHIESPSVNVASIKSVDKKDKDHKKKRYSNRPKKNSTAINTDGSPKKGVRKEKSLGGRKSSKQQTT